MYLWIICAENLLWFIVEIQVEILLSPAQLCLCCPASGWDRSADLFESKEFAIPENGRLPKLICSGNYQDQPEITWKRPLPQNFFFLRPAGSLSWHSFGYLLPLSSSGSFQEGFFFLHSLLQFGGVTWAEEEDFLLLFGSSGLLSIQKPWRCSLGRKVTLQHPFQSLILWCVGFIGDLCFCCALDVLRMSDSLCRTSTHTVTPQIY